MKHFKALTIIINKNLRQSKYDIETLKRESYMVYYWTFGKLGSERPQMVLSFMRIGASFEKD